MTRRVTWLVLLASLGWAGSVLAQGRPLRVDARQSLDFGTLLAGIPQVILPTDPVGAASLRISGRNRSEVLVSFLLPPALDGPGGAVVPLVFGPGSAGYSPTQNIGAQTFFDPSVPTPVRLPQNGRGTVFLGGTAHPPPTALPGAYIATITLTISYVGN